MHLPIGWVEPVDISNAVLFLASDGAPITGVTLPIDAGSCLPDNRPPLLPVLPGAMRRQATPTRTRSAS